MKEFCKKGVVFMKKMCPECDKEVIVKIESKPETVNIKGEQIENYTESYVCQECLCEFADIELESKNINRHYDIYKKNNRLLSSNEIKKIREESNLSQKAFALVLGLGEKTITRYENGAIQDKAIDNLIRASVNKDVFNELFVRSKNELSETDCARVKKDAYKTSSQILNKWKSFSKRSQGGKNEYCI